ncbi:MAG: cytochrome c oxidase subunit 4 [Mucilaginibacter sp.]
MTENKKIIAEASSEKAKPEILPKPTYWPFFLAMGLAFIFWGLLTTWVILLTGALIFINALIGWINILRHEKE